tara:strand:- start:2769 stop:3260 length:492 start_codon:yes stop_codon:yes gene_type:complete
MSLIDDLARRSAAASYAKFCHVEGIMKQVAEELDTLWEQMRPVAFAAADEGRGKYQLEYMCNLEGANDLTDHDIEAALPEELAAIRRMNGGRLIVIRKYTTGNTFLINIHFSVERDRALEELKQKNAGKRQREDVKPEVKEEKQEKQEKQEKPQKKKKVKQEQ